MSSSRDGNDGGNGNAALVKGGAGYDGKEGKDGGRLAGREDKLNKLTPPFSGTLQLAGKGNSYL